MSIKELKKEIEFLRSLYPKDHNVFRILSGSVDDLRCSFTDSSDKKHTLICSISVSISVFVAFLKDLESLSGTSSV